MGAVILFALPGFCASDACSAPSAPELRPYSIKLNNLFTPQAPSMGLYLKARIDGGPVLRLLLDSGAQHIVLDQRAAARLARTSGVAIDLAGVGRSARVARRVAPGTVEIGGLVLRDCAMVAVDAQLLEGIDGVIPMSLFAGFLVHYDAPGKTLDLEPYPADAPAGYTQARDDNRLLFLEAQVNETRAGYVLLDTGATYNAIAQSAAAGWRNYRMLSANIPLRGGMGLSDGFLLPPGVRFRVGSYVVAADPAVVVDLSEIARHHQFEVAGVLGYPALRRARLTIDYRDALVRMDGK